MRSQGSTSLVIARLLKLLTIQMFHWWPPIPWIVTLQYIRIIKNILKNEIVCRDIYHNRKKAQEQDDFGNKMKYHFHITTVHKYHFFVFYLYSNYIYLCRVVMWLLNSIVFINTCKKLQMEQLYTGLMHNSVMY